MSRTHPIARRPPTFRLPAVWPPAAAADDPCRRATAAGPDHRGRHHRHVHHVACGSGARSQSLVGTHPHPPPLYKGRRICGWVGTRRHEKHCFRGCRALVRGSSERAIDVCNTLRHNRLRLATSQVRRAFRRSGRPYHHRGWECGKSKAVAGQSKCNRGNELRQHEATAMPPTVVVTVITTVGGTATQTELVDATHRRQ